MDYKYIIINNYDLYIIKNTKIKTIDVKFFFYKEINKEEVTFRNCLIDTLFYACNKYPTKRALTIKASDLYSLYLKSCNMRFGNYIVTKLGTSFLNPKYTEDSMLEESLKFLHDTIFDPLVDENGFNNDYLNVIKNELRNETETIKENSRVYSNVQLLSSMEQNKAYSISSYSDISLLDQVDGISLYNYYKDFLTTNKIVCIVVGDVSENRIVSYFKNNFIFNSQYSLNKPIVIEHDKIRKRARYIVEDVPFQQSKLAIALKTKDLTQFEFRYVLNIYNSILGGNSDNLLMKNVREKHSLAYYVNSSLCKSDNLLIINSGIDAKNYNKVIKLVKKSLSDIQNGNFSLNYLEKGKTEYITAFDEAMETSSGMIDILLGQILFQVDDVQTRKKEIMKVTREDVINLAKKVSLDTIYFLKGV